MSLKGNPDNLPKWARAEMELLQRQAAELRRDNDRLRAALAGNGESPFSVEDHARGDIPLPDRARSVIWSGGDGFELRLHSTGDDLEVMCTSWHGVAIRPQASNVVRIGRGRTK